MHARGMAFVPREVHIVHTTHAVRPPKQGLHILHTF
jgi:hypothetical protein